MVRLKAVSRDCRTGIAQQRLISKRGEDRVSVATCYATTSRARCAENQTITITLVKTTHRFRSEFATYPLVLGGTVPSLQSEGVYASRRFFAHRCLLHICCRGQCNWRCYAAVSGCALAQHHRHHQAAVATSSEASRQLHDPVSVDRRPAVLQHPLLLT
jgi:hypothetical protein